VPISQDQIRWTNGAISIAQSIALLKAGHRGIRVALATTQVVVTVLNVLSLLTFGDAYRV